MKSKLYILVLLISCQLQAQDVLKLEDAVKIALENNFDIKLATNDVKIAEANSSAGNAGMLPNISATITNSNSIQNITQTQADGSQKSLNSPI